LGQDDLLFKTIKTDVKLAQKLIGSINKTLNDSNQVVKIKASYGRYLDRDGITLSWVISGDKMIISNLKAAMNISNTPISSRMMEISPYLQSFKWKQSYWGALVYRLRGSFQTGVLDDDQASLIISLFLPSIDTEQL
jgi:hypothetical protein